MGALRSILGVTAIAVAVALGGCAEVTLGSHTAKRIANHVSPPPTAVVVPPKKSSGRPGGIYKVGEPYQVAGVWYYPKEQPDYDETGIASWYGPDFHGKATANGETYDMNDLTAAHQTLPMPSMVRVTNLENGRSILLRVNDRGPFVNGRIIDVSRRGAQLLGFFEKGTARVRVAVEQSESGRFVADKPQTTTEESVLAAAAPRDAVVAQELAPPSGTLQAPPRPSAGLDPAVKLEPVKATRIFIQAGAFSAADRAARLSDSLRGFGPASVSKTSVRGQDFHRVRIGPLASVEEADVLLAKVIGSGHAGARIVVD